jgi:hypothetical protein
MRALGRAEMDETRLAPKGCHRWAWRARPEHDKPVNYSGPYRPLPVVTSYHEHLCVMREWGRGLGKYGRDRDEMATVDHEGSGALVKSERGEVSNAAYPELGCSNGVVDEVREVVAELSTQFGGWGCGGERTRALRSRQRQWRLGSPLVARARRKEGLEAAAAHRGALRPLAT